jgi:histidinol-phosphatase
MVNETQELLLATEAVARVAGNVALASFGRGLAAERKADGSPVTAADRAAERAARDWLAARYPADAVLGEEWGASGAPDARRWIIDPIDGTKTFVAGVPLWGTLIACARGEDVLAGAIYCAAVGEMLVAARGEGCWWNGARASVSQIGTLDEATVLTTDERFASAAPRRDAWRSLAARTRLARTWGDCYGYLLVATGRAEAMVDGAMSVWDSAALLPVIEEAGGVFTDWAGRRTGFGGEAIATNGRLAAAIRAVIGGTP